MTPARADRCLTRGLALVLGLALAAASAATLAGCEPADPYVPSRTGRWRIVEPYPGAPDGTVCWSWRDGYGDTAYGGPHCVEPNPPVCTAGGAQ